MPAQNVPLANLEATKVEGCIQGYDRLDSTSRCGQIGFLRMEFSALKNIYCHNSRLSSLCMRALIERYVAGDTATDAQYFLSGGAAQANDNTTALNDPSPLET